jgi:broad specificity phosphatase PhoE
MRHAEVSSLAPIPTSPTPKLTANPLTQSENKYYSTLSKTFVLDPTITDPKLTPTGHAQALAMGIIFESHLRTATHILSSPLSRCLESACLTFKDAIKRGAKICAVPELQSMGTGPNGTGMSLPELKERYEGGWYRERDTRRDFRRGVDFKFMCEDWNNPDEKRDGGSGRYMGIASRMGFVRGFLRGLVTGHRGRGRLEVVFVTHSSLINQWVGDGTSLRHYFQLLADKVV